MYRFGPSPIHWTEFRVTLLKAWGTSNSSGLRLGLAVSGGADSMALSFLCSRLQEEQPQSFKFMAFIIDHAARRGSIEECSLVAKRVEELGITSKVIRLDWGSIEDPLILGSFESQARRLRYRALGVACRDAQLRGLLLGHHQDDQAETIMMRIIERRHGSGLHGMKEKAQLPECFDIFGVGPVATVIPQADPQTLPGCVFLEESHSVNLPAIHICRPLLGYSKEHLVMTCESASIQWIEDLTNRDRSFTLRNTVRHIFSDSDLPKALQKQALLSMSTRKRARKVRSRIRAESTFQRFQLCKLDKRSGKFTFRAPVATTSTDQPRHHNDSSTSMIEWERAAEMICNLVSPDPTVGSSSLAYIADKLSIPDRERLDVTRAKADLQLHSFTAASLMWTPIVDENAQHCTWEVSRQPIVNHEYQSLRIPLPVLKSSMAPLYQLFDGRFWIMAASKVDHDHHSTVYMRWFRPDDLSAFEKGLETEHERRQYRRILKAAAPGRVRWTLPIVVDVSGKLLALPTLGLTAALAKSSMLFSARYKGLSELSKISATNHSRHSDSN